MRGGDRHERGAVGGHDALGGVARARPPPVGGTGTPSVIRGDVDAIEAANELTSRDMQVMSRLDDVAQKRRDETAARRKAEAKRKAEERRRAEEEAKRKAELERSESWWRDGGQSYHRHDGLATAYLAVRVACTVDPEPTIRSGPGGEPGCYAKSDDPRAQDYIRVMETVTEPYGWGDGTYSNNALGSCTQASGHIIRATVDPDCWENSPENIQQYLEESPEWERVGELGGPRSPTCANQATSSATPGTRRSTSATRSSGGATRTATATSTRRHTRPTPTRTSRTTAPMKG